jgi:hypothetical protein
MQELDKISNRDEISARNRDKISCCAREFVALLFQQEELPGGGVLAGLEAVEIDAGG